MSDDWMAKIAGAQGSRGGCYPEPGVYDVEIAKCKRIETKEKQPAFVVELNILRSGNEKRPVGTTMDWFVDVSKLSSPGNIADFCLAAFTALGQKTTSAELSSEVIKLVTSEANPLRGAKLRLVATMIKTRAGKDFTKCEYFPLAQAA